MVCGTLRKQFIKPSEQVAAPPSTKVTPKVYFCAVDTFEDTFSFTLECMILQELSMALVVILGEGVGVPRDRDLRREAARRR